MAHADLCADTKALTQALEEHASQADLDHEAAVQKRPSSPNGRFSRKPYVRPNSDGGAEQQRRIASAAIALPPLRKGDVMIDPLPISKEKEQLLSRTRPSWLPPKDPREEKKHLKEYQRMMAASLQAEKRRAASATQVVELKDSMNARLARVWETHVLPNWDTAIAEPRTRELWWRGIAPRSRGEVWQRAVGNELHLSEASYTAALGRAKVCQAELARLSTEQRRKRREARWFEDIERDAEETFPELRIFQAGRPMHEALLGVLMAYSFYRSDVGYSHGIHLPTALLLLTLFPLPSSSGPSSSSNVAPTFITLANLLNRPLPLAFLTADTAAIHRTRSLVLHTLSHKFPTLHAHLTAPGTDVRVDEWLDPLFSTLLCGPRGKLGVERSVRVMDVVVFEGDRACVRAAVAVLGRLESRLYGARGEVLEVLGWEGREAWEGSLGSEEEFLGGVREAGKRV
ncbi:hypothetical protein LTS18_004577 [Coniosporium uncinatum]|uniref:Uncharacterized protein n=1 Tax=Coniosporium uncinatum TaxID=93489 RepID=A0ACC3D607_9PEZI|nr:hypothetical protein LTS18_004577 [Coniosporium uncinatum]